MSEPNWLLICEIYSVFHSLEVNCYWDLDNFELSKLVKSVYHNIYPRGFCFIDDAHFFKSVLEDAQKDCWGSDHLCDDLSEEEVSIFHKNMVHFIKGQLRNTET